MRYAASLLAITAALALGACGQGKPLPQGKKIAEDMPDTSQANASGTAPDAGATGVVPANGAPPPVQPNPPPQTNLPAAQPPAK